MTTQQISLISKQTSCLIFLLMIVSFNQKLIHAQQPSSNAPPPLPLHSPLADFIPSTVITMVLILCAFLSVTICAIFLRSYFLVSYAPETIPPYSEYTSSYGLDPAVISTFPIFVYSDVKELKVGKGALECAVCLSEFEDDDMLRLIPKCDHVFHPECIDAWLASHVTCPVCRAMLSQQEEAKEMFDVESQSIHANSSNAIASSQEEHSAVIENEEVSANNMQTLEILKQKQRNIVMGKFPRSHSTGHSLVKQGECTERYTLRLSEEMRKQLAVMSVGGKVLKRTRSYDVFVLRKASVGEGSSRGGWRSWVASMTPRRFGGVSGSGARGGRDGDGSSRGNVFSTRPGV